MPVTLQPPPGRIYPSDAAALAAWRRGEPFVVCDRSHPRYGEMVTRRDLPEPVIIHRQP